jgi:hypothetical protein
MNNSAISVFPLPNAVKKKKKKKNRAIDTEFEGGFNRD